MNEFPRTTVGGKSLSRLVIGTNWLLGYSHTSKAKDEHIKQTHDTHAIAEVIETFLRRGIDTLVGPWPQATLQASIQEAQQRAGRKVIVIGTPHLPVATEPPDWDGIARELDRCVAAGAEFVWPHQATTDALLDRRTKTIRHMDRIAAMTRERGAIPGLSTHMPETVRYADATGLDAASYIQIYNAAGFLMQVEVDWVHRVIQEAQKPVLTIKPMAAGRLLPLVGLGFVWGTIRPQDMVAVGCSTSAEAEECIEISWALLDRRPINYELQRTRSKLSLDRASAAPCKK